MATEIGSPAEDLVTPRPEPSPLDTSHHGEPTLGTGDEWSARLPVVVALAVPVVVLALVPGARFRSWPWLSLCLTAPIAMWGGWPFHSAAWRSLRRGRLTVDTLASVSAQAAFGWSVYALFGGRAGISEASEPVSVDLVGAVSSDDLYLGVTAVVVALAVAGRWLASRAGGNSGWDTRHEAGVSIIAGASVPGRPPRTPVWGRAAGGFALVVLGLAAASAGFWLAANGDGQRAGGAAAAVLMLAYPAGVALAMPLVQLAGHKRARQLGFAVTHPEAPAVARNVDTLGIRGAGTLTVGRPAVTAVATVQGTTVDEAFHLVGSLGLRSQDPALRAIAQAGFDRGIALHRADIVTDAADGRAKGVVDGRTVEVSGRSLPAGLPPALAELASTARPATRTVVAAWDGQPRAGIVLSDPIRTGAAQAVARLQALGVRPVLVSDHDPAADRSLATATGIDEVIDASAGMASAVARLRENGHIVAVLADQRDPVSLARADLGVAATVASPGGGSIGAAHPSLVRNELWTAVDAIRLCRILDRLTRQNIGLALVPGLAVLPLAVAGRLDPVTALGAMAVSAAVVVLNSLRVRRFRRARPPGHRRSEAPDRSAQRSLSM